jgi:hypothetical protein
MNEIRRRPQHREPRVVSREFAELTEPGEEHLQGGRLAPGAVGGMRSCPDDAGDAEQQADPLRVPRIARVPRVRPKDSSGSQDHSQRDAVCKDKSTIAANVGDMHVSA